MAAKFDMSDYVDVAERIREFAKAHPEGSLQAEVLRWPEPDFPFVAVQATAYRSPEDPTPGTGLAWENFPGRTPYTKDSELQNAETSAWGRAIVAVLAADTKRGIASQQEVSRQSPAPSKRSPSEGSPSSEPKTGGSATTPTDPSPVAGDGDMGECDDCGGKAWKEGRMAGWVICTSPDKRGKPCGKARKVA